MTLAKGGAGVGSVGQMILALIMEPHEQKNSKISSSCVLGGRFET